MRLKLPWISRKKYILAPVILMALLLAIAACGSDSSITQSDAAMEAERMEAEAMAMEEEHIAKLAAPGPSGDGAPKFRLGQVIDARIACDYALTGIYASDHYGVVADIWCPTMAEY